MNKILHQTIGFINSELIIVITIISLKINFIEIIIKNLYDFKVILLL